jgi:cytochrome d ubiquinol oxidase subunit I
MLRMAVGMIAITAPLQLVLGDMHGLNTLEHQPVKVAAMEGRWHSDDPGDLILFGIPDQKAEKNHYEIAIPHAGSLTLTHSWSGKYAGLTDVPPEDRPPVANVFFAFRTMVGIGVLLIVTGITGAVLWWRGRLFETRWYLQATSYMWPLGFIAILAGWMVTEQGRQPFVIYGVMRTADAISPVPGASVATTLALFVFIYGIVFSTGLYFMNRLIERGPKGPVEEKPSGLPSRPLSAAEEEARAATGRSPGDRPGRPLTAPGGN